jgi:hypothetical protein
MDDVGMSIIAARPCGSGLPGPARNLVLDDDGAMSTAAQSYRPPKTRRQAADSRGMFACRQLAIA